MRYCNCGEKITGGNRNTKWCVRCQNSPDRRARFKKNLLPKHTGWKVATSTRRKKVFSSDGGESHELIKHL